MAYDPNMIMNFVNQNNNGLLTGIGQGINQLVTNKRDERQAAADMEAYQGILTSAVRPEDGKFNPTGWMDAINSAPDSEKEKVIQMYNVANAQEQARLAALADDAALAEEVAYDKYYSAMDAYKLDPSRDNLESLYREATPLGIFDDTEKTIAGMDELAQSTALTQNIRYFGLLNAGKTDDAVALLERDAKANEEDGNPANDGEAEELRKIAQLVKDGDPAGAMAYIGAMTGKLDKVNGKDALSSVYEFNADVTEGVRLGWAAEQAARDAEKFDLDKKAWAAGLDLAIQEKDLNKRNYLLDVVDSNLQQKKYELSAELAALEKRRTVVTENTFLTESERKDKYLEIDRAKQVIAERQADIADADLTLRQQQAKRQDTELSIKVMTAANEIGTAEEIEALNKMAIDDPEFGEDILGMLRYATIRDNGGAAASEEEFNSMIKTQRDDFLAGTKTYFETETKNEKLQASLNAAKAEANPKSAGILDIASINALQQMIDDATVREGDVVLMQSAESLAGKLQLWKDNKAEGDILSKDQRDQMAALSSDLVAAEKKYVDVVIVPSLQLTNRRVDPGNARGTYEEVFAGWFDPKEDATYGAADASGLTAQNIEQALDGTENYEER